MSKRAPEPRPSAPRHPVETPHGLQLVIRSDPWEDAPLSEVMIRVTRAVARRQYGPWKGTVTEQAAQLYGDLRDQLGRDGFLALSSWASALAFHAREGRHPALYSEDVIRRSRQHQANALRGRPWVKQR